MIYCLPASIIMGREKSEFHSRSKVCQKASVQSQAKSRSAKKLNHRKKEFQEVDSLMVLNDSKDKKEVNGLDERIQLLKSELKMLLGDTKLENQSRVGGSKHGLLSQDLLIDRNDLEKSSALKMQIEPINKVNFIAKQSEKPSPKKFSEWLDKTIDEMNIKTQNQKKFSQSNDSLLNFEPQKSPTSEKLSTPECSLKSKFINSLSLSQDKVEQLLYRSFYLQNFDIYLSSSDENDPDQIRPIKSSKTLKSQKQKTRKSCKSNKEKFYHNNLSRFGKSSQRKRKKRGTVSSNSSKNNAPQVHYSASNTKHVMGEKNVECVELDVSEYDWSEPFEIEDKSESSSDIEIIENYGEKKTDGVSNYEGMPRNNSGPVKLNAEADNPNEVKSKLGWECPICFEQSNGQEVVATQCGHVFCKKCLESHMSKFCKNCPSCRTDLTDKPTISLFNF